MNHTLYLRDDTVEVTIEVAYHAVYRPAQISGPPERCYPDESELGLIGYLFVGWKDLTDDGDAKAPTDEEILAAYVADEDRIIAACWEDFRGN